MNNILRPKSKQPIPKHAKCVFEGVIFAVYQWEQPMFDGTTETFEKIKRTDTVSIIPIDKDGKIIQSKQEQPGVEPYYGSIGGRVDEGEDPLTAAKRELLEETGMEAGEWQLWYALQPVVKIDWAIYSFIAKDLKKVAEPNLDSGEKIELVRVSLEEMIEDIIVRPDYRDHEVTSRILKAKQSEMGMKELRDLFGAKIK